MLVGEKLDSGIREDAEEGCRVAFEETADAGGSIDVPHRDGDAGPRAGVFCEVGVAGLKEDFYAIEGADHCLGLIMCVRRNVDRL